MSIFNRKKKEPVLAKYADYYEFDDVMKAIAALFDLQRDVVMSDTEKKAMGKARRALRDMYNLSHEEDGTIMMLLEGDS